MLHRWNRFVDDMDSWYVKSDFVRKSLFNSNAEVLSSRTIENKDASSANNLTVDATSFDKPLM